MNNRLIIKLINKVKKLIHTGDSYIRKINFIAHEIISNLKINKHYRYSIAGQASNTEYSVQCINLSAVFKISLFNMAKDIEIISGLRPSQACFVGLEYVKKCGWNWESYTERFSKNNRFELFPMMQRYGKYKILYVRRNKVVCFIDINTLEKNVTDPRTIISLPELLNNFDSTQAFYLGVLAGIKMKHMSSSLEISNTKTRLRVV